MFSPILLSLIVTNALINRMVHEAAQPKNKKHAHGIAKVKREEMTKHAAAANDGKDASTP